MVLSNFPMYDLIAVNPYDVLFRVRASFMPPITNQYKKIYVDLLGPLLALMLLVVLTNYGYTIKNKGTSLGPNTFLFMYSIIIITYFYLMCKLGQSNINFVETVSLLGYALYGHVFTIAISYWCFDHESIIYFFLTLILFNGSSTLRLVLILMPTILRPALRLIVCSYLAILQILAVIFIHFAFMHRTYEYPGNEY